MVPLPVSGLYPHLIQGSYANTSLHSSGILILHSSPMCLLADTQTTLCAIRRKRPFVSMHFVWVMWPSKIISLDFFTCFFMRLPVAGGIMFFSLSIHLAVDFYFYFLPTWRYASAGTSYGPVSVSVSVHLSQVSVLSKRIDGIIWFLARRLPLASPTLCFKAIQVSKK